MASELRYVFDANVIVSALLFRDSTPATAFHEALVRGTILVSQPIIEELSDVLRRPKFDRYVTSDERDRFLVALIHRAELVVVAESVQACRDPKDDQILELAISGRSSHIITGDDDLLTLNPFRGVQVLAPAAFLDQLAT